MAPMLKKKVSGSNERQPPSALCGRDDNRPALPAVCQLAGPSSEETELRPRCIGVADGEERKRQGTVHSQLFVFVPSSVRSYTEFLGIVSLLSTQHSHHTRDPSNARSCAVIPRMHSLPYRALLSAPAPIMRCITDKARAACLPARRQCAMSFFKILCRA